MTRRSPATGCWSESSEKQLSSTRSVASSICGVGADDVLGLLGVAGQQRLGGQSHGVLDVAADDGEVAEDGVELVMESLTHREGHYGRRVTRRGHAVNGR